MATVFEWNSEAPLLDKVRHLAQQQGRSPDAIITDAVVLYLQNQLEPGDRQNADLTLKQRRAFMKLPLQERHRMLQAQAEAIAPHYQQDTEWRELQAGDLIEY
ncbi:MAG: hypothetical protein KME42_10345 [Tildeniella nuda ZEHNDER 1965/U140]|jgi:hypothetical protein|nr:hypothetical protein [Tildeniella nuda ZEHNDER 1965/U140]